MSKEHIFRLGKNIYNRYWQQTIILQTDDFESTVPCENFGVKVLLQLSVGKEV